MTSRIAINTFYNLAGGVLPIILVLFTVPLYLHQIGEARYGVMAIVWLFAGYFSILDMGLSRATTNQIAQLHAAPANERQSVFWTALLINGIFGLIGALCLWGAGEFLITRFFKMPDDLHAEVLSALPWIAAAVPLSTLGGVLNGTLEARDRFLHINLIQLFGSTLFQLIPLAVAFLHGPDLSWLIPAAILTRMITFLPLFIVSLWSLPVTGLVGPDRRWIRSLLGYGGWMTATNLLGTMLTSLDQFFIGSILGFQAVSWYNIPFNLLWRMMIFPTSLIRVLFPELSKGNHIESLDMTNRSLRFIGVAFAPLTVISILVLKPFLSFWVGKEFALHAAPVGLIFPLGIWLNAIASAPLSLIQARGRPDLVVKVLLVEALPFIGLLWLSVTFFGVEGAAWSWTFRNLLYLFVFIWLGRIDKLYVLELWPAMVFLGVAWVLATLVPFYSVGYALAGVALAITATLWSAWREPRLWSWLRGLTGSIGRFFS